MDEQKCKGIIAQAKSVYDESGVGAAFDFLDNCVEGQNSVEAYIAICHNGRKWP